MRRLPENGYSENWMAWRIYFPHAESLLSDRGEKLKTKEAAEICYAMADYLNESELFQNAQPFAQ